MPVESDETENEKRSFSFLTIIEQALACGDSSKSVGTLGTSLRHRIQSSSKSARFSVIEQAHLDESNSVERTPNLSRLIRDTFWNLLCKERRAECECNKKFQ